MLRNFHVALCCACFVLAFVTLMTKELLFTPTIILCIMTIVSFCFCIICLLDIIAGCTTWPSFWNYWIMVCTAAALFFFLCGGLALIRHIPRMIALIILLIVTGVVFLLELFYWICWTQKISHSLIYSDMLDIDSRLSRKSLYSKRSSNLVSGYSMKNRCVPTCRGPQLVNDAMSYGGTFHVSRDVAPMPSPARRKQIVTEIETYQPVQTAHVQTSNIQQSIQGGAVTCECMGTTVQTVQPVVQTITKRQYTSEIPLGCLECGERRTMQVQTRMVPKTEYVTQKVEVIPRPEPVQIQSLISTSTRTRGTTIETVGTCAPCGRIRGQSQGQIITANVQQEMFDGPCGCCGAMYPHVATISQERTRFVDTTTRGQQVMSTSEQLVCSGDERRRSRGEVFCGSPSCVCTKPAETLVHEEDICPGGPGRPCMRPAYYFEDTDVQTNQVVMSDNTKTESALMMDDNQINNVQAITAAELEQYQSIHPKSKSLPRRM